MPRFGPISQRELVGYLRELGFDGPYEGGKHLYVVKGGRHHTIPNPHGGDLGRDFLGRLLKQLGISRDEWEAL